MDVAPRFRIFTWNISFDKEIERIRPQQPAIVERTLRYYGAGELDRSFVCELFREDLVDAVVFTDFHPRWDSYRWPPAPEQLETQREAAEATGVLDDPAFRVERRLLASIVRLAEEPPADSLGLPGCTPG
jgi:hypothetical protein